VKFKTFVSRGKAWNAYLKSGKTDRQLEIEKELQAMVKGFDSQKGSHPSVQGERDTSKLLVHDSDSGGDKTPYKGLAQEDLPSLAKVPTTSTGQKL
jgi:hypothetical protein